MGNVFESVGEFFSEAFGATDYELKLSGAKPAGDRNEKDSTSDSDEHSSLLRGSDGSVTRALPAIIHPFRLENYGISVSFFNTGIAISLLITPVTYYLINTVGASSSQVNAFITLVYLPWSLKFIFGIITDTVSIFGWRRKSWMLIGWISYCLLNIMVTFFEKPGLVFITVVLFFSTSAYLQADVCNDAQSIERSKFEPIELRGSYQTAMYTIRGFGMIISSIQATLLYNTSSFGWGLTLSQLFWLSVLIPATTVIPFTYFVVELKHKGPLPTVMESILKIWDVLQLKAVWYPLIFYLLYNCLQLSNSAWSNYLVLALGFSDFDLGIITISGAAAYFLGVLFFQRVAFEQNWREVMVYYGILYTISTFCQILLFQQANQAMGISNLTFACLITAMQYFFVGINSMPLTMISVMVCPKSSEGVMYAVLTTMTNLAGTVALDFSTILSYAFDVSNSDLTSGVVSGMNGITVCICLIQLVPLFLVRFSPGTRMEQQELIDSGDKSVVGGALLVGYIVASLLFTVALNFTLIT